LYLAYPGAPENPQKGSPLEPENAGGQVATRRKKRLTKVLRKKPRNSRLWRATRFAFTLARASISRENIIRSGDYDN
jgi:hypothetical protein